MIRRWRNVFCRPRRRRCFPPTIRRPLNPTHSPQQEASMRRSAALVLASAWMAAGCSALGPMAWPPKDGPARVATPSLPPMVYGVYLDNDVGAINFAAWAFAAPSNTRGNPAEAARAIIAVEYLAG